MRGWALLALRRFLRGLHAVVLVARTFEKKTGRWWALRQDAPFPRLEPDRKVGSTSGDPRTYWGALRMCLLGDKGLLLRGLATTS